MDFELKVCVGYKIDGEIVDTFPAVSLDLRQIEPIYESLEGWQSNTVGITDIAEMPPKAREYIDFLSESIGVEIGLVSTGPERGQTAILKDSVMEGWFA
jgi:adenylosuccinate synthase